jgi:hypothetical protein
MGEVLTKAERVRRREHLRGGGGACAEAASLSPTLHSVMHPETAEVYWGAWTNLRPLRRRGSVRGISVYRSQLLCPFARE